MALDLTGVSLGTLIADTLNLPPQPIDPSPEQEAIYLAAKSAQLALWTQVSSIILSYIVSNSVIAGDPITIIAPPSGGACTGIVEVNIS